MLSPTYAGSVQPTRAEAQIFRYEVSFGTRLESKSSDLDVFEPGGVRHRHVPKFYGLDSNHVPKSEGLDSSKYICCTRKFMLQYLSMVLS